MNPKDFCKFFITTFEGGWSVDPKDNGNWWHGDLVGSKYGVTAAALSLYRNNIEITKHDIADLTLDDAVNIALSLYYTKPKFSLLPWNRVTASVFEKGWGSGPKTAIRLIQGLIKVPTDGIIGQHTATAYGAWIAAIGEEAAALQWARTRDNFDLSLHQPRFIKGWENRTHSYLPGTKFWQEF